MKASHWLKLNGLSGVQKNTRNCDLQQKSLNLNGGLSLAQLSAKAEYDLQQNTVVLICIVLLPSWTMSKGLSL